MTQEKEMSFIDHLEELRWHIIRVTLAVVAAALIAFLGKSFLFDILIFGPTKPDFFTFYTPWGVPWEGSTLHNTVIPLSFDNTRTCTPIVKCNT